MIEALNKLKSALEDLQKELEENGKRKIDNLEQSRRMIDDLQKSTEPQMKEYKEVLKQIRVQDIARKEREKTTTKYDLVAQCRRELERKLKETEKITKKK